MHELEYVPHISIESRDRFRLGVYQLIAIPLILCVLTGVLVAGITDIATMSTWQSAGGWTWLAFLNPFNFIACATFFVCLLFCFQRMTWYGGWQDLRMTMERVVLVILAVIMTILWLGAGYDPFGWLLKLEQAKWVWLAFVLEIFVVALKVAFIVLARRTLRESLANCCSFSLARVNLKILIPLTLANLLAAAAYLWLVEPLRDLQASMRVVLATIGFAAALAIAATAMYQQSVRRKSASAAALSAE